MSDSEDTCSCKYGSDVISTISIIYIIGIIIWILIIYVLELYKTDAIGLLILSIPIIYFAISMFSLSSCESSIEGEMLQYDVFLFGGALIAILVANKYIQYVSYFYKLIFVGVLLAALSITDAWLSKKNLFISKHIRTMLQTASIFIFVFLFYSFYVVSDRHSEFDHNPFVYFNV